MKKIIIEGNKKLSGTIKIGGAKNSAVAIIPAALLADGTSTITNVPNITDKDTIVKIMETLGAKFNFENGTMTIDTKEQKNILIPEELTCKLRASYYFMGILLGKYKKVEIFLPGGCKIGERPIDFHLEGFEKLGAKVVKEGSKYIITAEKLKGAPINLKFPSVGATINILFAAVYAEGKTIINNAAREVEIVNVIKFLKNMGAKITGEGTSTIEIEGVRKLNPADIEIIPDRIEAGTYVIIGALIGENLKIEGIVKSHMEALLSKLDEMNVKYKLGDRSITISKAQNIKPVNVKSLVYPGFPTDLGQPMHVLLTQAEGISYFEETIYENRMAHIKYLNLMNANICVKDNTAVIKGHTSLTSETVTAQDLRGGAALVLAGLISDGRTVIKEADHILRGYERIIQKLLHLGAKIKIEEE